MSSRYVSGRSSFNSSAKSKSIDLSATAYADERGDEMDEEGTDDDEDDFDRKERDMFENAGRKERSMLSTWKDAGAKKDRVLQTLISKFSMLIHKNDSNEIDERLEKLYNTTRDEIYTDLPADVLYTKLPSTTKSLIKIIDVLDRNDSSESRDFTVFIAKKQWVKSTVRPLLELCTHDHDIITVQYCRKLLFWLLKDLSAESKKALVFDPFRPPKEFKVKDAEEAALENAKEKDGENGPENQPEKPQSRRTVKRDSRLMQAYKERKQNAIDQYQALLSFKEAICSERAVKAIVMLFGKMWQAEIAIKEEFAISKTMNIPNNKLVDTSRQSYISVNVALICVCRLLEIDTIPACSSPNQVKSSDELHSKLIVYIRQILMCLPGIFTELYTDIKSQTRYFDSWLSYLFRILRHALRRFRAKDLFLVWQEGGLLSAAEEASFAETQPIVVPSAIQNRNRSAGVESGASRGSGALKSQLVEEKNSRAISLGLRTGNVSIDSRHSRFGGVLVRPILADSIGSTSKMEGDDVDPVSGVTVDQQRANNGLSSRATAFVKRGSQISLMSQELPTGKSKSSRRTVPFTQNNSQNTAVSSGSMTRAAQEASVVMASVADLLCESKGLNEMIKRVNEDLRRDEGIFYDDMEIVYFEILSKLLTYNRYKLMAGKEAFNRRMSDGDIPAATEGEPAGWIPDLRNMIEATSNMSENRIVRCIEDLLKKKDLLSLHKPMECFKELLCYIRIELESANLGHRDLAVAALFRIFYTLTTDRRDPLPKLLSEWKSSAYTKQHSECLVELVHETMKTLDLAHAIYSDEEEIAKARKVRLKKGSSMDIEQYTAAAYRFDTDEYFRKLVSNGSVRLYTRLLEKYSSNDASVNHYVYCFFHRLNNYKLEQPFPTPHPMELSAQPGENTMVPSSLSLGHMLFNLHTMDIFSKLLNDVGARSNKLLFPLMDLGKIIVRRFAEASQKNHLLFVECLFLHPNPVKHACERIDNIYEAQAYKPGTDSFHSREKKSKKSTSEDVMDGEDSASDDENNRFHKSDQGFVVDDGEDEFDETDFTVAAQPKNFKRLQAAKQKELKKQAKKEARKARKLSELGQSATSVTESKKSGAEAKVKSRAWSTEEDAILRELYPQYVGTHSLFTIIAEDQQLRAIGRNRSANAVERRCRELELHMRSGNSEQTEALPSGFDSEGEEEATQPQRPVSNFVDSLDLDDYELATNDSSSKKRKVKRNNDTIADSDDDEDFAEDIAVADSSSSLAKGKRSMIIDSDDE